ncbi:MAG: alpha/beta hydrolase [Bdellovibrionota bacterium]
MAGSSWQFFANAAGDALKAAAGRLVSGPKLPNWSFSFEVLSAVMRGHLTRAAGYDDPPEQRVFIDAANPPSPSLRRVVIEETRVGSIPAKWFKPKGETKDRTLLFLHGGGYVIYAKSHAGFIASLATILKAKTLVPDYRLAPEHPFPAAIEDAVAAYEFLLEQGTDPRRIVIAGDSAGGGLTLATLLALRDKKRPLPALACPLSPFVDTGCSGKSFETNAPYDWLVPALGRQWGKWYLSGQDSKNPLASPLFADLSGLPPIYIQAGKAEILIDQIKDFARRAQEQKADCTLEAWTGMTHDFQMFADVGLSEAKEALRKLAERVDLVLGQ